MLSDAYGIEGVCCVEYAFFFFGRPKSLEKKGDILNARQSQACSDIRMGRWYI